MVFTEEDLERHENATECHICHRSFGGGPDFNKVRDQDQYTGLYRGAAHSKCNILMRKSYKLLVFFHNFRGYASHLVVQALGKFKDRKIRVLGQTIEKYLTISWGDHIVFKDSLQVLNLSVENLVGNLLKYGKENFHHLTNAFDHKELDLLMRKGVYPTTIWTARKDWKTNNYHRFNHHSLVCGIVISTLMTMNMPNVCGQHFTEGRCSTIMNST